MQALAEQCQDLGRAAGYKRAKWSHLSEEMTGIPLSNEPLATGNRCRWTTSPLAMNKSRCFLYDFPCLAVGKSRLRSQYHSGGYVRRTDAIP